MGGVKSEPSGASPVFSIRKYMMTRVFKRLPVLFLCLVCCRMPAFSQAVDLGLSVKWASCNVGASYPEEAGDYFAWGEVSTKHDYSLRTYRWSKMSTNVLLKYNVNSALGKEDGRTELELRDDAAHVLMGGTYRIPTTAEWTELHEKCRWIWTFRNGVAGYEVENRQVHLSSGGRFPLQHDVFFRGRFGRILDLFPQCRLSGSCPICPFLRQFLRAEFLFPLLWAEHPCRPALLMRCFSLKMAIFAA